MFELNIFQLIFLIGLGNAIILLFSYTQIRRKYRRSALYLGLFIVGYLLYQANLTIIPVIQSKLSFVIPNIPVLLFLPALFLFFVESTLDSNFKIGGRKRLFLLPGFFDVIQSILSWIYVLNNPVGPFHDFLTGRGKHFAIEGTGILFSFFCLIYILKRLAASNLKKAPAYNFYQWVIAGLLIILLRWVVIFFTDMIAPGSYNFTLQYYFWLFDTVFLLYTGYKILVSPKLLKSDSDGFTLPEKDASEQLSHRLKEILAEKKLYLNPNLTRNDLAAELNVNEVFISSLLNEGMQTTFYELINRYRVEEAIRLIRSKKLELITVDALAKEAGFKSKSTFNKSFKQITGTTPTRYRDRL